jgi:hypothetical protein
MSTMMRELMPALLLAGGCLLYVGYFVLLAGATLAIRTRLDVARVASNRVLLVPVTARNGRNRANR